jgi:hypothetical protein
MSEIDNNKLVIKPHTGILSVLSIVLSILAIIAAIISVHRIEAVQDSPVCLIAETPGYNVIHSLCTIFPTGSLVTGVVALKRMFRGRRKLWSQILASGGVIISLAVLVVYWVSITHLASGHVH